VHAPASVQSWLLPDAPLHAGTSVVTHVELAMTRGAGAMRGLLVEMPQTYLHR
jgi:hypothetical protein